MSHKLNRSLEEVKQFNPIQNGLFRGCSRMGGYDVKFLSMTSPINLYHVIQIILWMWSCDQSLVTVAFL